MAIRSLKNGTFSRSLLIGNEFYEPPSFNLIQTYTLSSAQSSVTFSSIPSTYAHLQIRAIARTTSNSTNSYFTIRFNSDSSANYAYHDIRGDGTGAGALAVVNDTQSYIQRITADNATASAFGAVIFEILDYKDTNKFKTIRNLGGFDNNGSGQIYFSSGLWRSTSAITSIILTPDSNNFAQYSRFSLYGISE